MNHDLLHHLAGILLRGALLLPVCVLIALLLRRGSASLIRRFWRCSLLALLAATALTFAPPIVHFETGTASLFLQPASAPDIPPAASPRGANVPGSPVASLEDVMGLPAKSTAPVAVATATEPASASTPKFQFSLPFALGLLWLAGALILSARKLLGTLAVSRLRRAADPVLDPEWQHDLRLVRESCGVSHSVQLRQHLALRSPIVTGLRKPVIILPADHPTYSSDDRRAVLLHELAHVRHRDALFHWVAAFARILHWPNPFIWFAERSMRLAEERASDDAVLNGGIAAPNYAELLAKLAKGGTPLVGDPGTAGESAMAQPSTLLPRVHAILRPRQTRRDPGLAATLTLATTTALFAIFVGGSSFVGADPTGKETPPAAPPASSKPPALQAVNPIDRKLDTIIIPEVQFDAVSLMDALEFIRQQSQELDANSEVRGINIISKLPKVPEQLSLDYIVHKTYSETIARKITLRLEQVPVRALLDYLCAITSTSWRTTDYAVIISYGNEMISKNLRIPAEILDKELTKPTTSNGGAGSFGGDEDPFGGSGGAGTVTGNNPRSAVQWLREQGVGFPEGSSAFYTRAASMLNVKNLPREMDYIEQIIDSLNRRPSGAGMTPDAAYRLAQAKDALRNIIIPQIDFEDASLPEALEYLRGRAAELGKDLKQPNPVQFVFNFDPKILSTDPANENAISITLKLRQVPLGVALKHVIDLANLHSVIGPYGIEIAPRNYSRLQVATFHLTPENMTRIRESIAHHPEHPTSTITLEAIGIPFPQATGSFWNPQTGDLIVRQTVDNLNQIEKFLEGIDQAPEE